MQFGSLIFIFLFLPLILFFGNVLKNRIKKWFLVLAGFLFYFFGMGDDLYILLFSIILNYLFGLFISGSKNERSSGIYLSSGITLNVLLIIFYKYSGFIVTNIESVIGSEIVLLRSIIPDTFPVGISFFTFVAISYLVDIHRNKDLVFKDPFDVAFTFSFFPKVFSGPITFHHKFYEIIKGGGKCTSFEEGVKRFVFGLGKKVLIADTLAKCVNEIFQVPAGELTFGLAWVGVLTFTLQIFIDFSGYTDMAIGIGNMLGFDLPENFNFPYIAISIRDFWKRWHITLSNWLQLYIFLPVAYRVMRKIRKDRKFGIKVEDIAYFTSSFITMTICGLWHGAEWTFMIWGIYHGVFLIIEHWKLGKFLKKKVWKPFQVFYALIVVVVGWAIFRASDMSQAFDLLRSMAGFGRGDGSRYFVSLYINIEIILAASAGILISFPFLKVVKENLIPQVEKRIPVKMITSLRILSQAIGIVFFIAVFYMSILAVIGGSYSPFIYFRF